MKVGLIPRGEPGAFRQLLLPEAADALAAGEPVIAAGLTKGDTALGAAAGWLDENRFQIISLYVAPEYRRRGGGRMLMRWLMNVAEDVSAGVEVSFCVEQEDHRTLIPFLEAMGFGQREDFGGQVYLTTVADAAKEKFFAAGGAKTGIAFSQLGDGVLNLAQKKAVLAGDETPEGGLLWSCVDRDVSVAALQGTEVCAYVAVDTSWPGGLTLSAMRTDSKKPAVMAGLLRGCVEKMEQKYPPQTPLAIPTAGRAQAALVQGLFPGAEPVSRTYYRPLRIV